MPYQIVYTTSANKELSEIPVADYKKVIAAVNSLADNPFPHGALKLEGVKGKLYRIRKGNYRIIYSVEHSVITVTILKIAHRKDVYRS
ncbi:type II toxin-antitoxin system RelE family toxin [Ferruginibacter sp.]|nr:type II toxin-antitoxin system RelE/ParE family toxin [Ferruginibacter sp.]